MSKYKVNDEVWVMFRNGDKVGYVPARGQVEAKVIGNKNAFNTKEYSVTVAPHIMQWYDEHEMFPSKEALFKHLEDNIIDR